MQQLFVPGEKESCFDPNRSCSLNRFSRTNLKRSSLQKLSGKQNHYFKPPGWLVTGFNRISLRSYRSLLSVSRKPRKRLRISFNLSLVCERWVLS